MNEIVNKFLLAEDVYALNASKTAWIYIYCLSTICKKQRKNTKTKKLEIHDIFMKTNELGKACF